MKENAHVIYFREGHHNGHPVPAVNGIDLTRQEKVLLIEHHFGLIMQVLGLDMQNESLRESPGRVAHMFVNEVFSGLDPGNEPEISDFENSYGYTGMLVEKNITVYSYCEHHFVPIIGKAHVAYFPKDRVIGLSKINRLVQYNCRRPQVQERLTVDIANSLKKALQSEDIAVMVDAVHLCVASRGVGDVNSSTITRHFSGKFIEENIRKEFMDMLKKY